MLQLRPEKASRRAESRPSRAEQSRVDRESKSRQSRKRDVLDPAALKARASLNRVQHDNAKHGEGLPSANRPPSAMAESPDLSQTVRDRPGKLVPPSDSTVDDLGRAKQDELTADPPRAWLKEPLFQKPLIVSTKPNNAACASRPTDQDGEPSLHGLLVDGKFPSPEETDSTGYGRRKSTLHRHGVAFGRPAPWPCVCERLSRAAIHFYNG